MRRVAEKKKREHEVHGGRRKKKRRGRRHERSRDWFDTAFEELGFERVARVNRWATS